MGNKTAIEQKCVGCGGDADGFTADEQPICSGCAKPKPKRRKLICLETYTTGKGIERRFGCKTTLPMSSADLNESENAAARIIMAVNAQLSFIQSKLRLVPYSIELKKVVSFVDDEAK